MLKFNEDPCLKRLRQDALDCLNTFPSKVIELNEIIEDYTPDSVKSNRGSSKSTARREARSPSTISSIKDYDLTINPEFDASSFYSLSTYNRSRLRRGVCKRRYYRTRGIHRSVRRRPGPLAQILAFIASKLAVYTRKIIISPSHFVIDNLVSILSPRFKNFLRRVLKNVQCGTPCWHDPLDNYLDTFNENDTVGSLANILRPAAVQLISDTTILKRWLQALALSTKTPSPIELANATRSTETIDCWAYELFFHLKYLRVNQPEETPQKAFVDNPKSNYELTHVNLWHRLIQLRNNYIILYEMLQENPKFPDLAVWK